MKKLWTALLTFLLSCGILFGAVVLFFVKDRLRQKYFPTQVESEIQSRMETAVKNNTSFSLTDFDLLDWDKIFFIFPYYDTEHLRFKFDGPFISSSDDGEMYLVFLKNGKYVEHVAIQRNPLDFSTCGNQECLSEDTIWKKEQPSLDECMCNDLIPKAKSTFDFDNSQNSFRSVRLRTSK